jgi:UDP-N-acetylmuramoyl-L-alanyl-D-glutamate--2,6-diaminopimelate ligase
MICVFGCGGDRDRSKRPIMGGIAARLSDLAVVTSDNPRTEPPQAIIDQIVAGVPAEIQPVCAPEMHSGFREKGLHGGARPPQSHRPGHRRRGPEIPILIAGKGHETYQIIGKTKTLSMIASKQNGQYGKRWDWNALTIND